MFLNIRLPDEISYGATGGPEFSTNVTILKNGAEHRNINWESPRYSYSIGYDVLNREKAQQLLAFFNIVHGRAYSFLFKDWLDFNCQNQILLQIDNSRCQLVKRYEVGSDQYFYNRKITRPKNIVIKNIDLKLTEGKDYTVNYTNGIINISGTKFDISKLLVNFEFDLTVRFESDILELSSDSFMIYSWKSIKLIETR